MLREGWEKAKARFEEQVLSATDRLRSRIAELQSRIKTPAEARELEQLEAELLRVQPAEAEFHKAARDTDAMVAKLEEQVAIIDSQLAELCKP